MALAIQDLLHQKPPGGEAIQRFIAEHSFPLVDLSTIASSPLSTSQFVIVKSSQESMLMPSLCGATWLSIFTFSTFTPLHWK